MESMSPLGIGSEIISPEIFTPDVIRKNVKRLTNQIYKLIPMREHEEDWHKQLNTLIIEVAGLKEIFVENPLFLQLYAKLIGLNVEDTTFAVYRKTVFECISLLQEMSK